MSLMRIDLQSIADTMDIKLELIFSEIKNSEDCCVSCKSYDYMSGLNFEEWGKKAEVHWVS